MASVPLLIRRLEFLYQRMREAGVGVLEFELGAQEKLRLALKSEGEGTKGKKVPAQAACPSMAGLPVVAPLSGIFYRSSSPSSPPFVEEGARVAMGDVLCIIEAMKVMNEIKASRAGVLRSIFGVNGKHVKKGDTIFLLEE
ncbi:MAG: biotin/lipoyl-containing protein [Elusimicrobiota bacterium]